MRKFFKKTALLLAVTLACTLLPGTGQKAKAAGYQPTASDIEITKNIKEIDTNDYFSAALLNDGTLYTWGSKIKVNDRGSWSIDGWTKPAVFATDVKEVKLGEAHHAIIKTDGSLWMWGSNTYGQLGVNDTETLQYNEPVKVDTLSDVVQVEIGDYARNTAAITADGSLYMWGNDFQGNLGLGQDVSQSLSVKYGMPLPQKVDLDGKKVKQVSIDSWTTAAVCEDGSLYMWGGQIWEDENMSAGHGYTPVKVIDSGVKEVTVDNSICTCLMEDGRLLNWGSNIYKGLGREVAEEDYEVNKPESGMVYDYTPTVLLTDVTFYEANLTSFALKKDGTLWSWGFNNYGMAGNGEYNNGDYTKKVIAFPSKILDNVNSILPVHGDSFNVAGAITNDGSLYTWGYGSIGSGKQNNQQPQTTPVKVLENVKLAVNGGSATFALKNDGSLWGVGSNYCGVLGDFTDESHYLPALITLKGLSPYAPDAQNPSDSKSDSTDSNPAKDGTASKIKINRISLSGISHEIAAGKKITLKATVTPSNASNKKLYWVSSNKKYATVSQNGVVTTKKAGAGKKVTITAYATDGSGARGTYRITIKKHMVKSITLTLKKKQIKAGKSVKIKATVKTTGKSANKKLQWTSSNTKYAAVNSKGVVKTKNAGKGKKVKITAKATDGSGKKKSVTIKIK